MKKRAMSHIEMILSFVIFILAIGFALYFFSPHNEARIVTTSLTYGFTEITKNVTTGVDIFFIKLDSTAIGSGGGGGGCTCSWENLGCGPLGGCSENEMRQREVCSPSSCGGGEERCVSHPDCSGVGIGKSVPPVGIDSPDSVDVIAFDLDAELNDGTHTKAFDSLGVEIQRNLESSKVLSEGSNDGIVYVKDSSGSQWSGVDFISITVNEDLESDAVGRVDLRTDYYEIISFISRDMVSEKRVLALKNAYDSDYFALKERFNFPSRANFGFSLTLPDGSSIEASRPIPTNFEVFSDIKRVEVLRQSGETEFGELKLWVW